MAVLTAMTTISAERSWPEMNMAAAATRMPTTSTITDERAITSAWARVDRPLNRRRTKAPPTDASRALPPAMATVMSVSRADQPDAAAKTAAAIAPTAAMAERPQDGGPHGSNR